MARSSRLTPMLRHYLEVKSEHPDAVVLYRMGDFYELFFEDAIQAAPILEVTLTARQKGSESEAPMCGVPHHALEVYLGKLVRAGLKVAICDQVEDPAQAKGLVKREVTRVVTPGTLSDPELLQSKESNFLASLVWDGQSGGGAFLDVSTGAFRLRRWERPDEAIEELAVQQPREILHREKGLPDSIDRWIEEQGICRTVEADATWLDSRKSTDLVERQMGTATLKGFGLTPGEPAVLAAARALQYARETQQSDLSHVVAIGLDDASEKLVADPTSLANLEVFRSQKDGGRKGTLLGVLDRTVTPPGGRLLKDWLRRPLKSPARIEERLSGVGELVERGEARGRLRELLATVGDPERLLSRAVFGRLSPREAAALRDTLRTVPAIFGILGELHAPILRELASTDPASDLLAELERVLEEAPAVALKDGGVIREGVDEDLDRHRSLAHDSKLHILAMEKREKERTGISSLKIRYNRVFGYYLEVTRANQDLVPEDFVRKQTLVNAERFITPELKELEEKILTAEQAQIAAETKHFENLRRVIVDTGQTLILLGRCLGTLDCLGALAKVAETGGYVRPRIGPPGSEIVICDGRHPVVERLVDDAFVPNDTQLDGTDQQIVILTGPNMGGKSTYLRQVALIVLMAQAGSFVPAASATIGAVDRIFTRVGASDDLTRGESTFMSEMIETARIIHQSTPESLVILDEVGRGTATFDGLSLAWAIVEHLHEHGRPMTLFATHYHELTELATLLPRVVNRTMRVREWQDRIIFLHRVVPGSSDKSYGLHVARLAGLPSQVVSRAAEVLRNLEAQEYDMSGRPRLAKGSGAIGEEGPGQLDLFAPSEEVVASILRDVDLERLSPLAAMNLLHALQSRLRS